MEVHLHKAVGSSIGVGTDSSILEMRCNCSEFRSCRSGLGGKSRQGGGRLCTCCLMVVLANSLAASLTNLREGVSAWLLASQPSYKPPLSPPTAALISQTGQPKSDREHEIDDLLGQSFPGEWSDKVKLDWSCAAVQLELLVAQEGVAAALERPLQVPFPSKILPLPLNEPKCPKCINSDGQPRVLERRRASSTTKVWIFVGKVVLRQPIETWACSAVGHEGVQFISPNSVAWTSTTGMLNVGNCWFFSILLLEAVTKHVRYLKTSPTEACERALLDSWGFMEAVASRHQAPANLPDHCTAVRKLYDAWYAYEMVLKKVDEQQFSICLKCGVLPAKLGADGCSKVAINLGKRASRMQVDYTPQFEKPLWTQGELLNHCSRFLLDAIIGGGTLTNSPIPVDLVPTMFHNEVYAGERRNTEAVKRRAASSIHAGPSPTTEVLTPLGRMISSGRLDPVALRSDLESGYDEDQLDAILDLLGCSDKLTSAAQKRGWILKGYDTLISGDSDCHMFVKAAQGTGGTCTISCPHGVVIVYKFCFSAESNRDHADNLGSLNCEPAALWYDDSCGLVSHREGMDPEEFEQLYGENRGCPKPWVKDPGVHDLVPIDIPELRDVHIRRVSARDPAIRAYAKSVLNAKGMMRCAPHPFCRSRKRLCLTDRFHQSITKKTHKRASCSQHLASMVRSFTHDRSNIMESLNARMRLRLRTVCTANPFHAILFYHRMVYWENRDIIEQQEREFCRSLLPGRVMAKDEVFKFAIEVCAVCGQQAPVDPHTCLGMTEGAGGDGGEEGEDEASAEVSSLRKDKDDTEVALFNPGVGDRVLYTSPTEPTQLAQIVKVHFDDPPEPYYTINIGGVERETIGSRLRASPLMASIIVHQITDGQHFGDVPSGSFPIAALPTHVVNMITQLCSRGELRRSIVASNTGQYLNASSFKGIVGARLSHTSNHDMADVLLYHLDERGREVISMRLDLSLRLTSEETWAFHLDVTTHSCPPLKPEANMTVTPPPLKPEAGRPLTSEEERKVNYALGPGSDDEMLAGFGGIPVTRYDMHKLLPGTWLNDEV